MGSSKKKIKKKVQPDASLPSGIPKDLHSRLKEIQKVLKKASIQTITADQLEVKREVPFGIPNLDRIGSAIRGNYTIVYGAEKGGKSTLLARLARTILQEDPEALGVLIDGENKFIPSWWERQGVDVSRVIPIGPYSFDQDQIPEPSLEDYLGKIEDLCNQKLISFCFVDSISSLVPKAAFQKASGVARGLGDDTVGAAAKRIGEKYA